MTMCSIKNEGFYPSLSNYWARRLTMNSSIIAALIVIFLGALGGSYYKKKKK